MSEMTRGALSLVTTQGKDGRLTDVESRAQLRGETDGAIQRALRAAARGDASDTEIRSALDSACTVAHQHAVPAEQLLILLKECWRELPEAQRLVRTDAHETMARVVTMCIDAYYAPFQNR